MKKEKLFEVIGEINENYISEAHQPAKRKPNRTWLQICAMAACFALILGLGVGGFNLHKDKPGEIVENPTLQGTDQTKPNTDSLIDMPIIWGNASEFQDMGFVEWNGKQIAISLSDALSDEKNKDSLFAIGVSFELDEKFIYNGKSLAEYSAEVDNENLLYSRLGELLKVGDSLKYGEALYKTGTPTGEKWAKELYDETVERIGEDLLAKYIVNGEFLKEKLESDIAEDDYQKPCLIAYENACNAFYKSVVDESIKQLKKQNINYERTSETRLVIFATADELSNLSLDNVLYFGLALKDGEGMDMEESPADDFVIS